MGWLEPDKPVGGGQGLLLVIVFIVGVDDFQLGLLRVITIRVAGLELLVVLDRIRPFAVVEFFLGFLGKIVQPSSPWFWV